MVKITGECLRMKIECSHEVASEALSQYREVCDMLRESIKKPASKLARPVNPESTWKYEKWMEMSVRATNALRRNEIQTIEQLRQVRREDIMLWVGCGEVTRRELSDFLKSHGIEPQW